MSKYWQVPATFWLTWQKCFQMFIPTPSTCVVTYTWSTTSKRDVIQETARADIRSVCGLGYPPKAYTQNPNECMNCLVKAEETPSYSKKEAALLPYVERIRREIAHQQEDQFLSVIGRGPYQLTDEFSFLEVEEQKLYSMTDTQKKSLKKKFFSMKMTETSRLPATGPITT